MNRTGFKTGWCRLSFGLFVVLSLASTGTVGEVCPVGQWFCNGSYKCSKVTVTGRGGDPTRCEGYRLPTEAEWEYAARAGTTSALYTGGLTLRGERHGPELDAIAWYGGNSGRKTHPVGRKQPNAWGLYDMLGNVWEWTWDWKGSYSSSASKNPTGPATGSYRVYRGCGWYYNARYCRAADRNWNAPVGRSLLLGFRPARSLP